MLKQRVITALVLAPLVIAAVLFSSSTAFAIGLAAVMLLGGWEWGRLIPATGAPGLALWLLALTGLMTVAAWRPEFMRLLPAAGVLWWLLAMVWLLLHERGREAHVMRAAAGLLVMVPAWAALVLLHAQDPRRVIVLLVLVWCADTGAYFAGKAWGRRRLAPAISPGKTWAGAAGGLLAAVVFALLVAYLALPGGGLAAVALLAAVTVIFSDFGDLFVSLMKRHRGVKDSGRILPGHGGVLDRLDSLFAASPVFVTGLGVLGL